MMNAIEGEEYDNVDEDKAWISKAWQRLRGSEYSRIHLDVNTYSMPCIAESVQCELRTGLISVTLLHILPSTLPSMPQYS